MNWACPWESQVGRFSGWRGAAEILENVRGADVFVISPPAPGE